MHSVRIKKAIILRMIQHAQAEKPLECCGLLSGKDDVISEIHPMNNHLKSPVHFEIDPQQLFQFFRDVRTAGSSHLGIYHSHPSTEPYPSTTDIEQSFYSDCSYFIVSLKNPQSPQIRAFRIDLKQVEELTICQLA